MPKNSTHSAAAAEYARAMLDLANEQNQAELIGAEFDQLQHILADNPEFLGFLGSPAISQDERGQSLSRIFGGQVSPLVANLIGVLNAKGRLALLPAVADAYHDLLDAQLGKIEVDITVAQRLDPAAVEEVRQRIAAILRKDIVLHQYVDESIIGGVIIRVVDKLMDASVRRQLQALRRQLAAAAGEG